MGSSPSLKFSIEGDIKVIKNRSLICFTVILMVSISFFFSGRVSAQAGETAQDLKLSDSGYEEAHSIAFSSDGNFLAVGGISGIYIFDFQKLSKTGLIQTSAWARSLAFVPGTDRLAAGLFDSSVRFWDIPSLNLVRTLDGPAGWVRSISISRDGALIASASDDESLHVWNVSDGSLNLLVKNNLTRLRAVALSPDGRLIAGAMGDNTVRVWSIPAGKLIYTLNGHTAWLRNLVFSPDGTLLASGSFDKNVLLWNMQDGSLYKTLSGHTSSILSLAFSPDGKTIASGSVDETIRLWKVGDGSTMRMLQAHSGFVYSLAYSPDGKTLASGGTDNTVRLWDMDIYGKPAPEAVTTGPAAPTDCRVCHHNRGQGEPPLVIGLRCESCHPNGANLEWCPAFPRSPEAITPPVSYKAYPAPAGLPVGGKDVAVVISSPSNGETLYANNGITAAAFVVGQIHANKVSLSSLQVNLSVWSGNKKITTLKANPSPTGQFKFSLSINPQGSIPYLIKPNGTECLPCHEDYRAEAPLPDGDVRLSVTVSGPDGQLATDERWIKVDASKTASQTVEVVDSVTQLPLPGLSVQASSVFYEWRSRFGGATTGADGLAQLKLNASSQFPTIYQLNVPKTVYHGKLYMSDPVFVTLKPGEATNSIVRLLAHEEVGQLEGTLTGTEKQVGLASQKIWAVLIPSGPAYQAALDINNKFSFNPIPVGQYIVLADPYMLAQQGFSSSAQNIDLSSAPKGDISISLSKAQPISGTVVGASGEPLPFAWVKLGENEKAVPVNPVSGRFLIPNLLPTVLYLTVSAPGYYSFSQPVGEFQKSAVIKLLPRAEIQQISWGSGFVMVPPETHASINGLSISLDQGWLWGTGNSGQPLKLSLPGSETQVEIIKAEFAIEKPVSGPGWLYIRSGSVRVTYAGETAPIDVSNGQMIALIAGSQPMSYDDAVVNALHPDLEELPIFEMIEPVLMARVQNGLAKAGISFTQVITFITYILSLVTIITFPLYGLFLYRGKRRANLKTMEKK